MALSLRYVMSEHKPRNYTLSGDDSFRVCEHYGMDEDSKNGGPNYLRAWREFRRFTQDDLAEKAGTTQGQIAHLEADRRELSAKWLRRLAPALGTTPGMLLDHDPNDLPTDVIEVWINATSEERRQLADMSRIIVKGTGTEG